MGKLVLLRHGQSQWNLENRFTGWVDIPLSEKGREEAKNAGRKLADFKFDIVYSSNQIRAAETLLITVAQSNICKNVMFIHKNKKERDWSHYSGDKSKELPVIRDSALNERYYGDLQGLNKAETTKKFGEENVHKWRRSFDIAPPNGESLKDTAKRTIPYFKQEILPKLKAGKNVLISAHGNSLRSIVMHLDNLSGEEIAALEIATGVPIVFEINSTGKVVSKEILE